MNAPFPLISPAILIAFLLATFLFLGVLAFLAVRLFGSRSNAPVGAVGGLAMAGSLCCLGFLGFVALVITVGLFIAGRFANHLHFEQDRRGNIVGVEVRPDPLPLGPIIQIEIEVVELNTDDPHPVFERMQRLLERDYEVDSRIEHDWEARRVQFRFDLHGKHGVMAFETSTQTALEAMAGEIGSVASVSVTNQV